MSIPGHVIFLAIISSLKAGHTSTTARFFCMYLLAGFVQVSFVETFNFHEFKFLLLFFISLLNEFKEIICWINFCESNLLLKKSKKNKRFTFCDNLLRESYFLAINPLTALDVYIRSKTTAVCIG